MLQKSKGIVLHTIKYSDTKLIVDMYTAQAGRSSFLVPIPRSKKAAVKSVLFQPLSFIEFETDVRPNQRLGQVKEAKSFLPFTSIPYDPFKSAIALFLAEFLYRAVREEEENLPLFTYLQHSISWLDACSEGYANFHLVFLMRLTRFLGLYPNLDDYQEGDYFDLLNGCFTSACPQTHSSYVQPVEAAQLRQLMRMNYDTMHLFAMNRMERARCLSLISDYYRLHLADFPTLKSMDVLKELFD